LGNARISASKEGFYIGDIGGFPKDIRGGDLRRTTSKDLERKRKTKRRGGRTGRTFPDSKHSGRRKTWEEERRKRLKDRLLPRKDSGKRRRSLSYKFSRDKKKRGASGGGGVTSEGKGVQRKNF